MLAPTGTVTLVFTDLRASERLWSQVPDTMRIALNQHDKILRESLRQHKGYEVKCEDGSFMLAFAESELALEFAADLQLRLLCADWPEALLEDDAAGAVRSDKGRLIFAGLRSSVGMHHGDVECRIDPTTGRMDYFGPTANRAARISAAAHEGQTLLSKSLQLAPNEQSAWVIDGLGTHQLRGLEGALELFELKPKSLVDRRFPPPLTLNAIRTNLQPRSDRFIGRVEQLEAIEGSLEQGHRLVTLMGASGLGKTRLAQRYGGLHLEAFPGGIWFCDIAEATDLNDVIACVGHTLAIPLTSGRNDSELLEQIGTQLNKNGTSLLILDNLEQAIEPSAQAIERWLAMAESLTILATSQERLRLSAEITHEVRPLNEAEGIELFHARVKELRGDYNPSVNQRSVLAEVIRSLDSIPLAIELAAAQIRHMSLMSLSQQIQQRLDLLSDESSEAPPRHRTLRAAIEWSWDLLTDFEKDVLSQASVFRGGFHLDAAEVIIEPSDPDGPWVMDLLESLNDKSLLVTQDQAEGTLRFSIYESIRLYAAEVLDRNDTEHSAQARHAEYFARESRRFSAGLYGSEGKRLRQELSYDLKNLQAVSAWGGASPDQRGEAIFAQLALRKLTGPIKSRGPLLKAIADDLSKLEPNLRGRLLRARAEYEAETGEVAAAKETLNLALATARNADDQELQGRVLGSLGLLHRQSAEVTQARAAFNEALNRARASNDDRTRSATLNNLAALEHDQARFQTAEELFLEAYDLCVSRQHILGAATAQMNLGTINLERGDLERARHFYHEAIQTFQSNKDQAYEMMVMTLLGLVDLDEGAYSAAKKALSKSLKSATDSGDMMVQIMSECWHGVAHWLDNEDEAAFVRLRASASIMRDQNNPKMLAFVHGYYGSMLAVRGRIPEAREKFRLARYLMRQTNNRNHLDALKIMVGLAAAALAEQAHQAGDEKAYARHLAIALQRRQFALEPTEPNESFPDGLPAPTARSADARMCLTLLQRMLSKLPGIPDDLREALKKMESPRDTLPPLKAPQPK
jgi:predicted ATPase/class 3 adenylate cyclase